MNNPLKFRIWDNLYHFYMIYEPKMFQYRFPTNAENNKSEYSGYHTRYFTLDECIIYGRFLVEQFTGKQYGDHQDLYVGDVVDFSHGLKTFRGIVVYSEYHAGFGVRYADEGRPAVVSLADPFMEFSIVEVLGNINENPELLSEEIRNIINDEDQ